MFPPSLFRFIWQVSGRHQPWICLLAAAVFVLGTVPLELQRRIVNQAFAGGSVSGIAMLVAAYVGLVLLQGLTKLALNIYSNWTGERTVRRLRQAVFGNGSPPAAERQAIEGVQLSVILDEAEPVGGFVGTSLSEPLQEAGLLLSVTAYLLYLQPLMALFIIAVILPQLVYIPLMQGAINRRVASRIGIMREMSRDVVALEGAIDPDSVQHGRIDRVFGLNMGIYWLKFTMNFLMNLSTRFGTAAVLGVGGYLVVTERTEIGTVVAFLSGIGQILDPWGNLVDWYRSMRATQVKYALLRNASELGAMRWRNEPEPPATLSLAGP